MTVGQSHHCEHAKRAIAQRCAAVCRLDGDGQRPNGRTDCRGHARSSVATHDICRTAEAYAQPLSPDSLDDITRYVSIEAMQKELTRAYYEIELELLEIEATTG